MYSTGAVLIGIAVLALLVIVMPVVLMLLMMLGMMTGFGGVGGMMGQTGLVPWPAWIILASWLLVGMGMSFLIVRGIRRAAKGHRALAGESPLTILQQRYAQGEIGHDEYERIRERLLRDRSSQ